MLATYLLLSVLGITSIVLAQLCSSSDPFEDLKALLDETADCITWNSDLNIQSLIVPADAQHFELPNLTIVKGSLTFRNFTVAGSNALNISLPALVEVDNALTFEDLYSSDVPELPALQTASTIAFRNVRFATRASLGTQLGALRSVKTMSFHGNKNLTEVGPFPQAFTLPLNGSLESQAYVVAIDNPGLGNINLTGYSQIPTSLHFERNAPALGVISDIVNGSFYLRGIGSLELPALSNLRIGDISNSRMKSISFPALETIAIDFSIVDYFHLRSVSFESLREVGGSLIIEGPFDYVNIPENVKGDVEVNVQTPGSYQCPVPVVYTLCGQPSVQSSSAEGSGGLSKGAKTGIGVGLGVGIPLILAGLFLLWYRKSKQRSSPPAGGRGDISGDYTKAHESGYSQQSDQPLTLYSKVPMQSAEEDMHDPQQQSTSEEGQRRPVSEQLTEDWTPPEQNVPSPDGRAELEEQQRPRHEMDARSISDMVPDDDEDADTRSLEDIERVHRLD